MGKATRSVLTSGDSMYLFPPTLNGRLRFAATAEPHSGLPTSSLAAHDQLPTSSRTHSKMDLRKMQNFVDKKGPNRAGFRIFPSSTLDRLSDRWSYQGTAWGHYLYCNENTLNQATDGCLARSIAAYGSWLFEVSSEDQRSGRRRYPLNTPLMTETFSITAYQDNLKTSRALKQSSRWSALSPKWPEEVEAVRAHDCTGSHHSGNERSRPDPL